MHKLTMCLTLTAAALSLAILTPAANAQIAAPGASDGSPAECLTAGVAQGLSVQEALRACMLDVSSPEDPLGDLEGAGTEAPSDIASCYSRSGPAGDSDGANYETVVVGQRPLRWLTQEERLDLREAAATFPTHNQVAGWTDFTMADAWNTAATLAREQANRSGKKADKDRARSLLTFATLALAAREGILVRGPWTKQQVKQMVKLMRDGPTPEMVTGGSRRPTDDRCALTAAAAEQLARCDANAWTTPDCQRLRQCASSDVTDPVPDGEIACGDPEIDMDALETAARENCYAHILPAPGEDPCAGWQGAVIVVRGGPAYACDNPAAQPLQDGCVRISLAPPGTANLAQVLATGLDRLGGPIIVLPSDTEGDPRGPHA